MDTELGRWQLEDQPAVVGVHVRKFEYVPEEGPGAFGILCVDDGVAACDHAASLPPSGPGRLPM
jgi:hypothetical protein